MFLMTLTETSIKGGGLTETDRWRRGCRLAGHSQYRPVRGVSSRLPSKRQLDLKKQTHSGESRNKVEQFNNLIKGNKICQSDHF